MNNVALVRKNDITELNTHADLHMDHDRKAFDDFSWHVSQLKSVILNFSQPTIKLETTSSSSPGSKFDVEVELGFAIKIFGKEKQNITPELIEEIIFNLGLEELCHEEDSGIK